MKAPPNTVQILSLSHLSMVNTFVGFMMRIWYLRSEICSTGSPQRFHTALIGGPIQYKTDYSIEHYPGKPMRARSKTTPSKKTQIGQRNSYRLLQFREILPCRSFCRSLKESWMFDWFVTPPQRAFKEKGTEKAKALRRLSATGLRRWMEINKHIKCAKITGFTVWMRNIVSFH